MVVTDTQIDSALDQFVPHWRDAGVALRSRYRHRMMNAILAAGADRPIKSGRSAPGKTHIYAVKTRDGSWEVCKMVTIESYGYNKHCKPEDRLPRGTAVWSRVSDTAWMGLVGQEQEIVILE